MNKLKLTKANQSEKNDSGIQMVVKSLSDLVYQCVSSMSGARTPAQKQFIAEQHIEAVQDFKNRARVIPAHNSTFGSKVSSDFLTKHVRVDMEVDDARDNFYKALKAPTDDGNLQEFQYRSDRIKLKCQMLGKRPSELKEYREWQSFLEKTGYDEIVKLVTTSTTTDFVPEGWSNQIQKYYYLALKVAPLFNEFTMPHNPFRWDILGRPTAHRRAEPSTNQRGTAGDEITASNPAQGVVTFEAEVLTVRVDLTEEFVEDTVDTYFDVLSQEILPEALAEGMESAVLNGDTRTGSNHQDDTGKTATDPETSWDGLRRHALHRGATKDVTESSGSFGMDTFSDLILEGGKYHINPSMGAWVCDIKAYAEILKFEEISTIDRFGNMATNVQGAVMMVMGRPLIVSEHIPLVNDSGVVSSTAADNTHGTLLLVNTKQYRIGNIPREEATQVLLDELTRGYYFTLTCRKDLQAMQPHIAGYTPVAMTLKI